MPLRSECQVCLGSVTNSLLCRWRYPRLPNQSGLTETQIGFAHCGAGEQTRQELRTKPIARLG